MASAEISRVYLDYNATAPLRPEARAATLEALDVLGNPSSIHAEGRRARAIVEEARRAVAALAGVEPRGVVFVSGGTEAANLALTPAIQAPERKAPLTRLIMSAGEHPCVLRGHRFAPEATAIAPLQADGRLDLDALAELLARGEGAPMLALQGANNETGVLQPVAEAAALVHAAGGIVVCDGVQLPGRIDLAAATSGADFVFLSAHKFGGPKGAGALIAMRPDLSIEAPLLRGGGQERGARAGTENVAAIAGFGAAARLAAAEAEREAIAARRAAGSAGATSARNGAGGGRLRRGGAAPAQHARFRRARRRRRDAADRPRSRRRRRVVRLGLFVGQGDAVARAGGDGRRAGARRRRDPGQLRLGFARRRRRPLRRRLRRSAGGAAPAPRRRLTRRGATRTVAHRRPLDA